MRPIPHHLLPLYLGGGHQVSNLIRAEGEAATKGAAHYILHELINEIRVVGLSGPATSKLGESKVLTWSSLASTFKDDSLFILIGILSHDGTIEYRQTSLRYEASIAGTP